MTRRAGVALLGALLLCVGCEVPPAPRVDASPVDDVAAIDDAGSVDDATAGDDATPDADDATTALDAVSGDVIVDAAQARDVTRGEVESAAHRAAQRIIGLAMPRSLATLEDGEYGTGSWDEVLRNRPPQGVTWQYPQGVIFYGLLRGSQTSNAGRYADWVLRHNEIVGRYYQYLRRVDALYGAAHRADVDGILAHSALAPAMRLSNLDSCGAMAGQILEGLQLRHTPPSEGQALLLNDVASYISTRQSRLPDGAFWRPEQGQTLWIDDLFMSAMFLVRWSRQTGDPRFLDDAARQVQLFAARQQDADGLWFHGNFIAQGRHSPFKWGRGNGWAMVATVEVLTALPERHPAQMALRAILRRHVDGLRALQTSTGHWRQLLDHPELWEDSSCTGMFAFAITRAVRRGWLPRSYLPMAWRAVEGLSRDVSDRGDVSGAGWGTALSTDYNYYATIPRPMDEWHARAAALLAASEVLAENEYMHR